MPDLVKVQYQQTGQSFLVNELGMLKKRLEHFVKLWSEMIEGRWFEDERNGI